MASSTSAWRPVPFTANSTYAGFNLTPHIQWQANFGYCGELSTITSGLFLGQYLSQYDVRAIGSPTLPQTVHDAQVLLGMGSDGNDVVAARYLRLGTEVWDASVLDTQRYLVWVKRQVVAGRSVTLAVWQPDGKSDQYDHIVTAIGIASEHLMDATIYYPDDVITIVDHTGQAPQYTFADFIQTRASSRKGPDNSVPLASGQVYNYATAITGVMDSNQETFPISVMTDTLEEVPVMKEGSTTRPSASPVTLTVNVGGLVPGTDYKLFTYDNFNKVPGCNFNAAAGQALKVQTVRISSGSTFQLKESIQSSEMRFYRCVEAARGMGPACVMPPTLSNIPTTAASPFSTRTSSRGFNFFANGLIFLVLPVILL
ncbi:hypothetical protein BC830DRAFT_1172232 [Chytriomyces sp. MP71]|nr:hypothetical protein BC830DRAFT_1172232 [Chytriomyces sp. MP71]